MYRFLILTSFILMTFVSSALAVSSFNVGSSGPISVESKTMSHDSNKNISTFTGNVYVRRGDLEVRADEMEVHFQTLSDVKKLVAKGNVKINKNKEEMRAMADKVEIFVPEDLILLTGSVKAWQAKNYLEGEKVTINNKTGKIDVGSGSDKRVKIIITPEKGE
jgi:lipopolysaccharide export system protein LptA